MGSFLEILLLLTRAQFGMTKPSSEIHNPRMCASNPRLAFAASTNLVHPREIPISCGRNPMQILALGRPIAAATRMPAQWGGANSLKCQEASGVSLQISVRNSPPPLLPFALRPLSLLVRGASRIADAHHIFSRHTTHRAERCIYDRTHRG